MRRGARLAIVLEIVFVLLTALCLWAPWDRAAGAATSSLNMIWLALPMMLTRHSMHSGGAHLETVSVTVTICALALAALGALLPIAARLKGCAWLWAAGIFLFASAIAILMTPATAVGYLGAVLLLLVLRARFAPLPKTSVLAAVLSEIWPVGYAVGFGVLAWHYNPQLLIKVLMVALGLSLVARGLVVRGSGAVGA